MSYSILLKNKTGEYEEILFSTTALFHDFWNPLFKANRLPTLSDLENISYLDEKALSELKLELERLKLKIKDAWALERLDYITKSLAKVDFKDYEFIEFG